MPDKNGFSVLHEYNSEFADYYRNLFRRYGKIIDYSSRLYKEKLEQPLKSIDAKIGKNENIMDDLSVLKNLIETKFGKTSTLVMPEGKYNYDDKFQNERKYDEVIFKKIQRINFKNIDEKLSCDFSQNYCLHDACVHYLKMVYDLYGKLQDEIRYYRSYENRTFLEFLSSMTFGFFSSITRSFNTYDSTADAYATFCSVYLLPDYELLFGFNGICAKFNRALEKVKQLEIEYINKSNLIGNHNNTLIFEIGGIVHRIDLGEIYLRNYTELTNEFNKNKFGIEIGYSSFNSRFIFKSRAPFTFKKESSLHTLIGFDAMDTVSWESGEEQIIFSRRGVVSEENLEKLRILQLQKNSQYFRDSIRDITALLIN